MGNCKWRWGSILSILHKKTAPMRKPAPAGNHAGRSLPCDISTAGASKDQKLAAIMTPPAKPSIPSSIFLLTSLARNTVAAPSAVKPQVKHVATRACRMGWKFLKESIMFLNHLDVSLGRRIQASYFQNIDH
jgi:hypothetical protein